MKNGKYGSGNTNFSKLTVQFVPISLWDKSIYSSIGCGAAVLATLTGINPTKISKLNNHKNHYSDYFMVNFLRSRGVSVYEVNKANLTNSEEWIYKINDSHALLYSCLVKKNEGSWFFSYQNTIYHNFSLAKGSWFDLVNFPINSMYVLHRDKWSDVYDKRNK
jgi:hypothetical protein